MAVAVAVAALIMMGFYAVTNPGTLAYSGALSGADWVGYAVCHRITSRSFILNGRQLPLCARCTGIYLGVALVFLIFWLSGRLRWSELPRLPILLAMLGFIGVMGIDGINSYLHFFPNAPHLYTPRNWLRLVTGMGAGLTMGTLVMPALAQTLWQQPVYRAPVGSWSELGGLAAVGGAGVLLVLSNQPVVLYVLAFVSVAGIVLILTAINCILLLVLLRRDAQMSRWRETAVPLTFSLLLTLTQLLTISFIRYTLTGTLAGFPGLN
ncbi:MAG: DUF2085 domain-containing protein [Chloroflexi bacterium]|nr:MAG: DUF2085 domain-containing protein [Chloroflexota bacterium]